MKRIKLLILFCILSVFAYSQTLQPSSLPTTNAPSSWYNLRGVKDSFLMFIARDTFPAKYPSLLYHTNGNFYYSEGNGARWNNFALDTSHFASKDSVSAQNLQRVTNKGNTTTNNIGIGTLSPLSPLHVKGGSPIFGYNKVVTLEGDNPLLYFNSLVGGGGGAGIGYSNSAKTMKFFTNDGVNAMTIVNNAVGLGTNSPQGRIHLQNGILAHYSNTDSNLVYQWVNEVSGKKMQLMMLPSTDSSAPNGFMIERFNGGNWRRNFQIDDTGRVYIYNPSQYAYRSKWKMVYNDTTHILGIERDNEDSLIALNTANIATNTASISTKWSKGGDATTAGYGSTIGTTNNTSFRTIVNGTERVYIDSLSGNVGLGRTPSNPISSYKLEVGGTGSLAKLVSDISFTEIRLQNTGHTSNIGDYPEGVKIYSNSNSTPTITVGPQSGVTAGTTTIAGPVIVHTNPNNVGIKLWKGPFPSLDANMGVGAGTLDSLRIATVDRLIGVLPDTATVSAATQSQYNTAIGNLALHNNMYASDNTAVGANTLEQNIDGFYNVGVGHHALRTNYHGWKNTSIGTFSLFNNTNGTSNTAVGFRALRGNTTGNYNTAVGEDAGYGDTVGVYNTIVGYYARRLGFVGDYNTVMGSKAGLNSNGSYNSLYGYTTGTNITTGTGNTFIGNSVGTAINAGSYNTAIGGNLALSASMNNNIILADGQGNIKAQHDGTNWTLTGGAILASTTNTGYISFHPQTTAMTPPVDGFKLYDSAGLTLLRSDGYRRVLSFQGLTANVKYNFPVGTTNDTVTTNTAPQTLTNKTISGIVASFSKTAKANGEQYYASSGEAVYGEGLNVVESQSGGTGSDFTPSTTVIGIKFTTSASASYIQGITLRVKSTGTLPTLATLTVQLYADNGSGTPTGSAISSGILYGGVVSSSYATFPLTLQNVGTALSASTTYWAIVTRANEGAGAFILDAQAGTGTTYQGAAIGSLSESNKQISNIIYARSSYGGHFVAGQSHGVWGTSYTGVGARGDSYDHYGIYGQSNMGDGVGGNTVYGNGVYGFSTQTTGGYFKSPNTSGYPALKAENSGGYLGLNVVGTSLFQQGARSNSNTFLTFTQAAHTGGTANGLLYTAGLLTNQTASTEATDVNFNFKDTLRFATGNIALQRVARMQGRILAFAGASTVTEAATLEIDAPTAGTNATLTNSYAIKATGPVYFQSTVKALNNVTGPAFIATNTSGYSFLANTNAATVLGSLGPGVFGSITNDASAILTLSSTTKGLLLPRMNRTQWAAITATQGNVGYGTTLDKILYSTASGVKVVDDSATIAGNYLTKAGTTTNDAAATGNIGEEINSTVSTYTNYTTTATYQNIASITLTTGDWDLSSFYTYSSNSSTITAAANAIFVISTTNASASGSVEGMNIAYVPQAALLGTSKFSDAITPYRVSISGTTTYYLNTQATFTLGNPQFVGGLRARRMR